MCGPCSPCVPSVGHCDPREADGAVFGENGRAGFAFVIGVHGMVFIALDDFFGVFGIEVGVFFFVVVVGRHGGRSFLEG